MDGAPWWIAGGLVLLALVVWVTGASSAAAAPLTHATLQHGPFEIVAEGRRISTGAFPNISGNPFATMEVTGFRVRWRGQDVVVPVRDRPLARFWRVLRLVDAPQPALLVSTTDFHLITEQDGRLVVRSVGEPSTNMAELQRLDAPPDGQPDAPRRFGIEKVAPQDDTVVQGSRWLKLSYHSVLDVQTLAVHPVRPWIPSGSGGPLAGLNGGGYRAVLFSPGRSAYVLPAYQSGDAQGQRYHGLIVIDIASGDATGHRIARSRMRYVDSHDFTADWVRHHFRWIRDAAGRELLAPIDDAKPLPWKGRFIDFGHQVEYRVEPVQPAMRDALVRFMAERFGAQVAPDWIDPSKTRGDTFRLPGCSHVLALGFHERHVGLFGPAPRGAGHPPDCQQMIRRIGEAFDAELASGRLDALFLDDDVVP
jgi:hypothetical protein